MKYITAVVSAKQAEADAVYEKFEKRSTLIANILSVPVNGGIPLIRQLFGVVRKKP